MNITKEEKRFIRREYINEGLHDRLSLLEIKAHVRQSEFADELIAWHEARQEGITHPDYWDCECEDDYIHYKPDGDLHCAKCGYSEDEMSDSLIYELVKLGYLNDDEGHRMFVEYRRRK